MMMNINKFSINLIKNNQNNIKQLNYFKRFFTNNNDIVVTIENVKDILNNLPDPNKEIEKFIIQDKDDKYSFLKSQKSSEFKGLLDTLRFPHEMYQNNLEGIVSEDIKEDGSEEKQEYQQMGGLKATIHSRSGSVYEGQVNKDGIPDGFGELELKNGDFYLGFFKNGKKDGRGRLISISGCQYDGEWKDDMHWGEGRFDENEKQISYQGQWEANERHGPGIHSDPKCEIKGIWQHDHLIFGHEVKKDIQLEYYGEYKNEQWCGNGKVSFPDGSMYQGEFLNGIPHGRGKFYKNQTNQITENDGWKMGIACGAGRVFSDGWCCEGVWNEKGEIQNAKVMIKGHGIYQGDINDQQVPHGQGKEYLDSGDYYSGGFIDGKRDGYGEAVWADKSQYKGQWVRGLRVGKGIIIAPGQTSIEGDFKEIILDDGTSKLYSKGTLTRADGSIYIGELENGLPEGFGEFKPASSNNILKGFWSKGELIKHQN